MPRPQPRPLLITFHCGVYFLYCSVFMMSIPNAKLEGHFSQMGEHFIRDMLVLMSACFIGYIGLWNLRKWGLLLLGIAGIPLCGYGFYIGNPILLNFLPLIASISSIPLWPMLK